MTIEEFSNLFDILVDSYRRFKDFDSRLALDTIEFDEYEKSVFLTQALESIVRAIYSSNYLVDSFENTEESRRSLDALVQLVEGECVNATAFLTDRFIHTAFSLPRDCWFIVYEQGIFGGDDNCISGSSSDIVPIRHDSYFRTIQNPFRGPNKKRILRLDIGHNLVELVSSYPISKYVVRYITRPEPIILCDLTSSNLEINNISTPQTCKLAEFLHKDILVSAVKMALQNRISNTNKETAK